MTERYGCDEKDIGHYTCHRTRERIVVDGRLSEAVLAAGPPSRPGSSIW